MVGPHGSQKCGPHLDVQLQGHGAHVWVEVEGGGGAAAQPVGHVLRVGERGAESHDADGPLDLGGDVAHPGTNDLQDRLWRGATDHRWPGCSGLGPEHLMGSPMSSRGSLNAPF